jgi:hypothetical protein
VPETSGIYLERFYSDNSKFWVIAGGTGGRATRLTGNAQTADLASIGVIAAG